MMGVEEAIPANVCCKKCGSIYVVASIGQWGPHTERVACLDCRAVTWGFGKPWKETARALLATMLNDPACAKYADDIRKVLR